MSALSPQRLVEHCRRHASALALLALAAPPCKAGHDLTAVPLEQLLSMEIYSASRYVQKTSQAPAMVTVISAADIRRYGWRSLADVARSVRGLYVSYDRNYSYLGERGFLRPGDYNTRFLLLIDGNRINDGVYDQAPLGAEFPLDLELVERIEFVPGPGSSIYGSNAFFGVINVVTRKPADLPGTRAAIEAGSYGARKVAASTSWRTPRGAEFLLAASVRRSDGQDLYYSAFDTPQQHNGVAQGLDDERGERLFASASVGAASLTIIHARRVKGVPTASFAQPFNDPRSQTTDRQTYLNAVFHPQASGPEQFSARLFWGAYDSFGDYVNDDAVRAVLRDGSSARWWGADLSVVSQRYAGHTLLAGFDYQRDYRLQQFTFNTAPYASYLDERRSGSRAGLYAQDEIALSPATLLNLGLRYDRHSGQAGTASPRAALIHKLDALTTVKLIHGRAFRAPNAYERFYVFVGPGGQLPNPGLQRETLRSNELALVRQLGERARLSLTVFHNVVGSLITLGTVAGAPEARFENADTARARGAELEYEQRWLTGAALRSSYSLARVAGGQQLNAPARLATFNLAWPLGASPWRGAFELQYVGRRNALAGSVPAFWLANANLYRARLFQHAELSIGVYNLFNERYADPASVEHRQAAIEQDGRTLRARVAYAF
jgi:outer membrane receptor protein involved in Fe transport